MNRRNFLLGSAAVAIAPAAPEIVVGVNQFTGPLFRWRHSCWIDNRMFVDGEISASQISANSITAGQIAVGAINATQIKCGNIIVTDHLFTDHFLR